MPHPSSAKLALLDALTRSAVGHKLQIAGKAIAYDQDSALLLLSDPTTKHAVLVDCTLVINTANNPAEPPRAPNDIDAAYRGGHVPAPEWLQYTRGTVKVTGYLERVDPPLARPTAFMGGRILDEAKIDPELVMRAALVTSTPDLDMALWRQAVVARNLYDREGGTAKAAATSKPSQRVASSIK